MKNVFKVTTVLPHNLLETKPCIRHNFSTQVFRKRAAQKCSAAQGPHSDVVPRAFRRLVSKSCDEFKGSLYQMSNVFVIIKMCYVHNQWYDISCATLYVE